MSTFPIPIEPNYSPTSFGNPAMDWIKAHESGSYIGLDPTSAEQPFTVSANRASTEGTWVDAPDGPQINGTFPQKWVPANPADPKNVIYTVATLYGRGGTDLWVLGPEAEAALALARATVVHVFPPVIAPPPAPPPGAIAWFEAMMAHFRTYF